MKKYTFLSMAVVAMLFAGCNKDEGTVSLGISVENFDGPKVEMGANTTPQFVSGDRISVSTNLIVSPTYSVTVIGGEYSITGVPAAETYYAFVGNASGLTSSTAKFTVENQQYQQHSNGNQKLTAPMIAKSTSNQLSFKNVCGLAAVTITNDADQNATFYLESVKLTASSANLGDIYAYSFTSPYGATAQNSNTHKSVSLNWDYSSNATTEGAVAVGGSKTVYIALPPFTDNTLTIEIKGRFGDATTGTQVIFTRKTNSLSLSRNKIGDLPVALSTMQQREIYYFSVGSSSKVLFSSGNLQYNPALNTWQFAPNQYNTILDGNCNIAYNYNGWIDLFGWGTGNNPIKALTNENYSTFSDWGLNIESSYNWRTLTQSEWNYLIYTRTNASSKKGFATVVGVKGMLLLPDNWTGSVINSSCSSYEDNIYSSSSWESMESYGAIFLPITCYRENTIIDNEFINYGYYWSSTPYTDDDYAYTFSFSEEDGIDIYEDYRYDGFAVRLVQNHNN